ncbi:MAG: hypothetical protein P8X47_06085 [Ignavibacteriaceae bacterium]
MIKKIITIAKWEYLEKVKTKTFIISLIVTPLLIISFSILPSLLFREESPKVEVIGVIDNTGKYFQGLNEQMGKYELPNGQRNYILVNLEGIKSNPEELTKTADKNVLKNMIEGYLLIKSSGGDSISAEYRSTALGNFKVVSRLEEALNTLRTQMKLEKSGLNKNLISLFQQNTFIEQKKIEEEGKVEESDL